MCVCVCVCACVLAWNFRLSLGFRKSVSEKMSVLGNFRPATCLVSKLWKEARRESLASFLWNDQEVMETLNQANCGNRKRCSCVFKGKGHCASFKKTKLSLKASGSVCMLVSHETEFVPESMLKSILNGEVLKLETQELSLGAKPNEFTVQSCRRIVCSSCMRVIKDCLWCRVKGSTKTSEL